MDRSKIEWTDATWNPVVGCTKVSPGCDNCYAERIVNRFGGEGAFATVVRNEEKLWLPLRWRRPRMIFVNSMSDLFHVDVPDGFIANVWSVMARTPQHTYQVLTKRHARMRKLLSRPSFRDNLLGMVPGAVWPLPNVWLGVSVEDQQRANARVPVLLDTPAAVRWLSLEPLLGPVDLRNCAGIDALEQDWTGGPSGGSGAPHPFIDWAVVGGESGPGARPMHPAWARALRTQCAAAKVPFFFKQWGEWGPLTEQHDYFRSSPREQLVSTAGELLGEPFAGWKLRDSTSDAEIMRRHGKREAGRELDGRTWDEYPHAITGGAR